MILGIGVHSKDPKKAKNWLSKLKLTIPFCVGFLTTNSNFILGNETTEESSEGTVRKGSFNGIDYFTLIAPKNEASLRNKFYNITSKLATLFTYVNDDSWPINLSNELLEIVQNKIGVLYSDIIINDNQLYLLDIWPTKTPYYICTKEALQLVNGFQLNSVDLNQELLEKIANYKIIYHVPEVLFRKEI